jgi:carbonic anhydrase/acetyltransferase-like protein (isoleucine patch superfamily)
MRKVGTKTPHNRVGEEKAYLHGVMDTFSIGQKVTFAELSKIRHHGKIKKNMLVDFQAALFDLMHDGHVIQTADMDGDKVEVYLYARTGDWDDYL